VLEQAPRQIAAKLQLRLTGEQERRLAKRYTENTAAYQFYLKGRFYQEQADKKAIEYFKKAIAADPTYALAYAGLADAWSFLGNFDQVPPDEAFREARAAALKALELDEELAEAHASLGFIRMCHDRDWVSAERDYKRALALNPGYAAAHSRYAWHLGARGRLDEAIERIQRTLELDPMSLNENTNSGWYLYMARRYEAAEAQLKKTLEMDANYHFARVLLGRVYEQQKKYPEAIAEHREAVARSGSGSTELAALAYACAIAGKTEEARKVFEQLQQRAKQRYVSPYSIAVVHVGLGEVNEAFEWLEKAYERRDGWIAGWIKVDPRFDSLRPDPRFTSLLRRLGLDP
jgi:tetratricopeptide (TPR) repeat protein